MLIHRNEELAAATAETILIDRKRLRIYSDGTAKIYGKFNWVTGATEVSATAFDFVIAIGGNDEWDFVDLGGNVGHISNVRLISSAVAELGILAW